MHQFATYLLSMVVVFFLWGAVWYNLDIAFGVPIATWWHNLTHKNPLPPDQEKGFLYRRRTKTKVFWATLLSTVQSLAVLYYSDSINLVTEMFAWFIEIPCMLLGMHILGRPLGNLWAKREDVFKQLDRLETGEITVSGEARRLATSVAGRLRGREEKLITPEPREPVVIETKPVPTDPSGASQTNPTPAREEPRPAEDPEEGLRRFIKKHGG